MDLETCRRIRGLLRASSPGFSSCWLHSAWVHFCYRRLSFLKPSATSRIAPSCLMPFPKRMPRGDLAK